MLSASQAASVAHGAAQAAGRLECMCVHGVRRGSSMAQQQVHVVCAMRAVRAACVRVKGNMRSLGTGRRAGCQVHAASHFETRRKRC